MKREDRISGMYFERLRERRNEELAQRMRRERTFDEMLEEMCASCGLNMRERELAEREVSLIL